MKRISIAPFAIAFATTLGHAEPSLIIQNKEYQSGAVINEWAQYTIDTSGSVTIKPGADVSFSAGSSIKLLPGFKVEPGAFFSATVNLVSGYNPGGYYDTLNVEIGVVGGDGFYGSINQFNLQPFDLIILDSVTHQPLVHAPVLLTINYGGGWLSATNGSNPNLMKTLRLVTDQDGTVQGYYMQGTTPGVLSSIEVVAGGASRSLATFSYDPAAGAADTDQDGIADTVELLLGLNPNQPTSQSTGLGLKVLTPQ